MTATLRQSPSGPFIQNANGGGFAPGPGATLRMNGVQAPNFPASSAANIPSAAVGSELQTVDLDGIGTGHSWVAALETPDPGKNYRVTGVLDINSATTAGAIVTQYLDVSNNSGNTWDEVASNTHAIGPGAAAADVRQCRIDMTSRTGAAIGVVANQAELLFRMRVSSPTPAGSAALPQVSNPANSAGDPVGTLYMELVEMF